MSEERIRYRDAFPKDYKIPREWQRITLDDIEAQWAIS